MGDRESFQGRDRDRKKPGRRRPLKRTHARTAGAKTVHRPGRSDVLEKRMEGWKELGEPSVFQKPDPVRD